MIECINCGKQQDDPDKVWPPGWGCLHGMLACCSQACAEAYHARECVGPFRYDADINGPVPKQEKTMTTKPMTPEEKKLDDDRAAFMNTHRETLRALKFDVVPTEIYDEHIDMTRMRKAIDASVADVIAIGEKLHTRFPEAQGKAFATLAVMFLAERRGR